jgi:hypothetical protein
LERKLGLAISTVKIMAGKHLAIDNDANATLPDKKEEEENTMTLTICEETKV